MNRSRRKKQARLKKRQQRQSGKRWTPLKRMVPVHIVLPNGTVEAPSGRKFFQNDRYKVVVTPTCDFVDGVREIQITVTPLNGSALVDWRDLQRIKNEMLGREAEAVQVFPAESRLVDTTNDFHLWSTASFKCPFGFRERHAAEDQPTQRKFAPHVRPKDLRSSYGQAL